MVSAGLSAGPWDALPVFPAGALLIWAPGTRLQGDRRVTGTWHRDVAETSSSA